LTQGLGDRCAEGARGLHSGGYRTQRDRGDRKQIGYIGGAALLHFSNPLEGGGRGRMTNLLPSRTEMSAKFPPSIR